MPFSSGLNSAVDTAQAQNHDWLISHGLICRGDASWRAVQQAQFHHLAALVYQHEDERGLALATNFITFLFFFDDMVDSSSSEIGTDARLLARVGEMMMMGVLGERASEDGADRLPITHRLRRKIEGLQNAIADITIRLRELAGSRAALEHYVAAMEEYFEGNVIEARLRNTTQVCDVRSYTDLRLAVSAVHPCLEIGALLRGLDVSAAVRNGDAFREMRRACNLNVSYVNDLFSYRKEALAGETSNLVHVFKQAYSSTTEVALTRACKVTDETTEEYLEAKRSRTWTRDEYGYAKLMESWMRGNMEWYMSSNSRYSDVSSTDVPILNHAHRHHAART